MEVLHNRLAVRALCLDVDDRVLLLHWRDPHDGSLVWEPPGGGIEPGETPLDAVRRELVEETGLDPTAIGERCVDVDRDVCWNGRRYLGSELFFLARFAEAEPALRHDRMEAYEQEAFLGHAWVPWAGLAGLPDSLEPPEVLSVLAALAPDGPWTAAPGGR